MFSFPNGPEYVGCAWMLAGVLANFENYKKKHSSKRTYQSMTIYSDIYRLSSIHPPNLSAIVTLNVLKIIILLSI